MNDQNIIVLYDGVCLFCSGWVKFVIRNKGATSFKFMPLQTPGVAELMDELDIEKHGDSIIAFDGRNIYLKSDASLFCMGKLKFPVNMISWFRIIPRFLRNAVYDFIGKHRYKIYGKTETCELPSAEEKACFIGFDNNKKEVQRTLDNLRNQYKI